MSNPMAKCLCVLLVGLQWLTAVASASGWTACLHADGTSCVEATSGGERCVKMTRAADVQSSSDGAACCRNGGPCAGCVDVPLAASKAVRQSADPVGHVMDAMQFPPVWIDRPRLAPADTLSDSRPFAIDGAAIDPVLVALGGIVLLT